MASPDSTVHYLLIPSPLVAPDTMFPLAECLERLGYTTSVVPLDNDAPLQSAIYEHHQRQIQHALATRADSPVIAVAHSGGGNLLAQLDPAGVAAYAFLDAILPLTRASRFDLFADRTAVRAWRDLAHEHGGVLPMDFLRRLGRQIAAAEVRERFVSGLREVPITLYEEALPVHADWPPPRPGLYLQWTASYLSDAMRAAQIGFDVQTHPATHFELLVRPDAVAMQLAEFAASVHGRPASLPSDRRAT